MKETQSCVAFTSSIHPFHLQLKDAGNIQNTINPEQTTGFEPRALDREAQGKKKGNRKKNLWTTRLVKFLNVKFGTVVFNTMAREGILVGYMKLGSPPLSSVLNH